jgi:tetratricopeptide (TPR) repeat protein
MARCERVPTTAFSLPRPRQRSIALWLILASTIAPAVAQQSPANTSSAVTADAAIDPLLAQAEQDIREARYAAAIGVLQPFVQNHPDSWRAHYDLGYALFRVRGSTSSLDQNLRQSIRELARSLELNEQNADAHKILGLDLTMIQRDDLAGREFAEAVRLAPLSAENHYFLGRYFMRRGEYENAAAELRKAIALNPGDRKALENLGITLDRLGSSDEALRCLQRAVELDEHDDTHSEEPYLDLARHFRDHGNTAGALQLALKAAAINPRSEEALLQLALSYRVIQDWPHALAALEQAAKLDPCAAQTQYLLGRTYRSLGKIELSQQAFASFKRLRQQQQPTESPDMQEPCTPPCSSCTASGSSSSPANGLGPSRTPAERSQSR